MSRPRRALIALAILALAGLVLWLTAGGDDLRRNVRPNPVPQILPW